MKRDCILALDQGTTSSRAIVFDASGRKLCVHQMEFPQHFPSPGLVEHDPLDIWESQKTVMLKAAEQVGSGRISAIGITNQRETAIVWDAETGKPICNAIVWQDRRTASYCDSIRALPAESAFRHNSSASLSSQEPKAGNGIRTVEDEVRDRTGLLMDPYFSGTKLRWILDNVPGARQKADKGELLFGTVDSYLIWMLTGGKVHATDVSNASRTLMFNIRTLDWDDDLLSLFGIPKSILPEVRDSSGIFGTAVIPGVEGIPIAAVAGDQQAALFGQMCFDRGNVKNTYGTGCFLLMNTGTEPAMSSNKLLSSVAWKTGNEVNYVLEGSVFVAGAAVQWLRDGLGLISKASDIEALALTVPDSGGVTFVPALSGLGAPYWDSNARGLICGISRGTTAAHIARAALEGICCEVADVVGAMCSDCPCDVSLKVDGGASRNNLLMQMQADVLGIEVTRPAESETTALGAALLAGLATGIWKDKETLRSLWKKERSFTPQTPPEQAARMLKAWHEAVQKATRR